LLLKKLNLRVNLSAKFFSNPIFEFYWWEIIIG
jgi:hypothetical protein